MGKGVSFVFPVPGTETHHHLSQPGPPLGGPVAPGRDVCTRPRWFGREVLDTSAPGFCPREVTRPGLGPQTQHQGWASAVQKGLVSPGLAGMRRYAR